MKTKNTKKKPSKKVIVANGKTKALRGVEDLDPRITVIKESASLIPFIGKTIIILGVAYLIVRSYKKRFIKKPENSNYPIANITLAEAETRADKIESSIGIFSGEFDEIVDAFSNNPPLNYNAFIRIYNAFGNRKSTFFQEEMNLTEWLGDQLNDYQKKQISTLTYGIII